MKHSPRAFWRSDRSSRQHPQSGRLCSEYSAVSYHVTTAWFSLSPVNCPYPLQLWSLYHQSVSCAARSSPPSYSEQRKFESTHSTCPVIPPSLSLLPLVLSQFDLSPRAPSRKHHCLDSCRSPSVDDSPSIPEDRPRGPAPWTHHHLWWVPTDHFERSHHCLSEWLFLTCSTSVPYSHRWESRRIYITSVVCRRPRISPDSSTLVSHFGTPSYMFPWMSGLRWRLYSEAIQFHASSSTQFSSSSVYHCTYDRCHFDPAAHQFLRNHIQ